MSDFLEAMAAHSAERAAAADRGLFTATFAHAAVPLDLHRFDVIAEIKNRSPAEGDLAAADADRAARARQYVAGGAAAISVLTEPSRFAGSLDHLEEVARAVPNTPVMRKDFLVDPIQLYEARRAGASGVLLIIAMLDAARLDEMLDCARELGLFVLLEAFDAGDLGRAAKLLKESGHVARAAAGQLLVGVNTRNLRTLEVDSSRLASLAPSLPGARCVAESGLHTPADAAEAAALGYRLALVGTALMRSDDPKALVAAMRAAGSGRIAA
jgi:indole-3-glycerol phosphate synthase